MTILLECGRLPLVIKSGVKPYLVWYSILRGQILLKRNLDVILKANVEDVSLLQESDEG